MGVKTAGGRAVFAPNQTNLSSHIIMARAPVLLTPIQRAIKLTHQEIRSVTLNTDGSVGGLQIVSQDPGTKTSRHLSQSCLIFTEWTRDSEAMTPVIRLDKQICSLVCWVS